MKEKEAAFRADMRDRMRRYLELREKVGDHEAREELLEGYPDRQRACMDPYLTEHGSLPEAIRHVLPVFEELGLQEEVVDCSTSAHEVALVVTRTCLCRAAGDDLGMTDPPSLHCELSAEATSRAYPDIDVEVVLRQVRGAHACGLRYTRPVT
ncbi:hypothetical protein [Nonomuraea sediminis]|uniref:hypothetical protein n=1 Tax=Nonomuraea sediminis TaxID=2835864 RepID=UPI001BDC8580|nr:hypothetical protein [Nonomuraea sediminis]